jgi:hypothetical protein
MNMANEIYLVQHGDYDWKKDVLINRGREQIDVTRKELLARGLGRQSLAARGVSEGAILLTAKSGRAIESAEIIGDAYNGLDSTPLVSEYVSLASNTVPAVRSLAEFIDGALDETGVTREADQPLVIITHSPLMAIAKGIRAANVRAGSVLEFDTATWNNPQFDPVYASIALRPFKKSA